ncbi:DUF6732 family protein [Aliiroseovarius sp. PTFE2010]|uniref:DUF6732 family protein n=1 Tax=Aliiroseovarius sp. PTFE2010 TaxID=3417190 RepID=UPI003CF342C6
MKTMSVILILLPGAAMAHGGHLADAAGHDHWVAGAALAAAAAIGLWGALKGKRAAQAQDDTSPENTASENTVSDEATPQNGEPQEA